MLTINQGFGIAYIVLSLVGILSSIRMFMNYRGDMAYAVSSKDLDMRLYLLLRSRISKSLIFIILSSLVLILGIIALLVVTNLEQFLLGFGLIGPLVLDYLIITTTEYDHRIRS